MAIRLAAELASKKALEENRLSASSSRLRIREILEKQRVQSLDRASPQRQTLASDRQMPFSTTANRQLWVFR